MMAESPPGESTSLTEEERAILHRSRLRGKRVRGPDASIDEEMADLFDSKGVSREGSKAAQNGAAKPQLSYRDKLTNAAGHADEWKDWSDSEDGEETTFEDFSSVPSPVVDGKGPSIVFSKEEKEVLWKPWRKALIIKPLHHSVGYGGLCNRAKFMWKLEGDFHLLDLGHGSYLARFSKKADYKRVLVDGPWSIGGYCLSIRRWSPFFRPERAVIDKLITWVRFPQLPVWCYEKSALSRIGSEIGKVVKLDFSTRYVCKTRFARLCVEIDCSKPLLPSVWVEGEEYKLQYEGLDMICFSCGRYGHRRDNCIHRTVQAQPVAPVHPTNSAPLFTAALATPNVLDLTSSSSSALVPFNISSNPSTPVTTPKESEEESHGPWLMVNRRNNRPQNYNKEHSKQGQYRDNRKSNARPVNSNTFSILRDAPVHVQVPQRQNAPRNQAGRGKDLPSFSSKQSGVKSPVSVDVVRSIRDGGSSQATAKALDQLKQLQPKFGNQDPKVYTTTFKAGDVRFDKETMSKAILPNAAPVKKYVKKKSTGPLTINENELSRNQTHYNRSSL